MKGRLGVEEGDSECESSCGCGYVCARRVLWFAGREDQDQDHRRTGKVVMRNAT